MPARPCRRAYAIDRTGSRLDLFGGVDGFPPPTQGSITPIGPLGFSLKATDGGFDISADGRAFAALTDAADSLTRLYGINLSTGAASPLGTIGAGSQEAFSLALVPGTEELPDTKAPVGQIDIGAKLKTGRLRASKVKFRFFASEGIARRRRALAAKGSEVAVGSSTLTRAGVGRITLTITKAGKGLLGLLDRTDRIKGRLALTLTDAAGNAGTVSQRLLLAPR